MASSLIELRHISKSFDDTLVLDDFNLTVNQNEFITLLGPSGCGKTTTLRIVGGFETPDQGQVFFEGKDITNVPPNQRHLNTVFQKYALFPHMNVGQNIAFGLKISGKSDEYIRDKVKYALKLVNLDGYEKRKIDALSGGQQQRIAMARAIVLGMVYDFLPFMVLPIFNTLMKIDDNIIEAAYDLGATKKRVLFDILLPLSIPGIASGVTMVFVPSLTTFVISNMLGGGKINLIGNIIEQEFTTSSNWNLGSGLSLIMMIFIVISMAALGKLDKEGEGTLI